LVKEKAGYVTYITYKQSMGHFDVDSELPDETKRYAKLTGAVKRPVQRAVGQCFYLFLSFVSV